MKIQLKRLGKKKVKTLDYQIDTIPKTLKELIESCVKAEVKIYNEKRENTQLISFLSPKDIQEQSEKGKIGFGDIANTTLAIEQEAIENALLGFKDGLFVVFVDDEEIKKLDLKLTLTEKATITFLRLTFLTGTYW
jgi:hypothetical protein